MGRQVPEKHTRTGGKAAQGWRGIYFKFRTGVVDSQHAELFCPALSVFLLHVNDNAFRRRVPHQCIRRGDNHIVLFTSLVTPVLLMALPKRLAWTGCGETLISLSR
jgi:hypothetical protein